MKTDSGLSAPTETWILQMYGSDAGQPPRSLYTKGLSPLCDRVQGSIVSIRLYYKLLPVSINLSNSGPIASHGERPNNGPRGTDFVSLVPVCSKCTPVF